MAFVSAVTRMTEPTPARVLVVDDEESLRFFLTRGLNKAGYHVDSAADGKQAIEALTNTVYDVVLTDLVMPEVGGLDVLAAVHELDRDSVVVLMTAHGTVENAIDALRLGAFDYLTKPFELKDLLVRVERGLERRSVERENRKLRFLVNKGVTQQTDGDVSAAGRAEPEGGIAGARRDWERAYVADLLRQTRGNVTKAAERAKISRPNLHKKIKALGLKPRDYKN